MIVEAFVFATQMTAPGARANGIASEQAAIVARYLRCRSQWQPHLENCRSFILAGAEKARGSRRAVVLGSGCLLDIPLAGLSRRFEEVVLVDAAQPLHARMAARRLGNVRPVALSLVAMGPASPVYRSWRGTVREADYVVASMLLSQLPPPRAVTPGTDWRRDLIAAALADLCTGAEAACLITETSCNLRGSGGETQAEDPLHGVAAPPALERWGWPLAPPGERADGMVVELDVCASLRPSGDEGWMGPDGLEEPTAAIAGRKEPR